MALGEDQRSISREEAAGYTVADIMIRRPKAWPADARVSDVREAFTRPSVRTVLLTDGDGRFVAAIERASLSDDAPADAAARDYAVPDPVTVRGELPMADAIAILEGQSEPRLIVVGEDGASLCGLVCAKPDASSFCRR